MNRNLIKGLLVAWELPQFRRYCEKLAEFTRLRTRAEARRTAIPPNSRDVTRQELEKEESDISSRRRLLQGRIEEAEARRLVRDEIGPVHRRAGLDQRVVRRQLRAEVQALLLIGFAGRELVTDAEVPPPRPPAAAGATRPSPTPSSSAGGT